MSIDSKDKEVLIKELNDAKAEAAVLKAEIDQLKAENSALQPYSGIFDSIYDGIIISDTDGAIMDWNSGCERMFGYKKNEIIGKNINVLSKHSDRDLSSSIRESINKDGTWQGDIEYVNKKGNEGVCETIIMPLRSGNNDSTRLIGIYRDITQHKTAEAELLESEENFRLLADFAPMGIAIVRDGKLLYFNPAYTELFSLSTEEMYEINIFDFVHPDMRDIVIKRQQARYMDKEAPSRYELKCLNNNGDIIWLDMSVKVINYKGEKATLTVHNDITGYKILTDSLKESEARLKIFLEHSPSAISIFNTRNEYIYVNKRWTELTGYTKAESKTMGPIDIIHTDVRSEISERYRQRSFGKKEPERYEMKCMKKSRQTVWIDFSINEITHQGEKAFLTVANDITQLKEARDKLINSETKWKSLAQNIPDIIYTVDSNGNLLSFNKEFNNDMTAELNKFNIFQNIPSKFHDTVKKSIDKVFNTGLQDIFESQGMDITERTVSWYETRVVPLLDNGKVQSLMMIARNISEQKRAEEEINLFFNTTIDMLCIAGYDGYFKRLSPTWSKTFGWSEQELMSVPFIEFVHEDDKKNTQQKASALEDGSFLSRFENRYKCKDGSYKWIAWNSRAIPERKIIIASVRDITEIKKNEQEMINLNAELEKRVIERTEQLEKAYHKLTFSLEKEKEYNDLQSRFINMISHEYRTPLTVITSSSELIKLHIKTNKLEDIDKFIDRINISVNALAHLVEDVVAFSGSKNEAQESSPSTINIVNFISNTCDELKTINKNDHQIIFESQEERLTIFTDKNKLRQILSHLILNAMKFSPEGSKIKIRLKNLPNDIAIIVSDSGAGLTRDDIKHIFDPFYKAKDSIGVKSGTGLGLPIVKKYVEILRGDIQVDSKPGKGSMFTIMLPKK